MTTQPEALRLAYLLEVSSDNPTLINVDKRCATELRRLHEVNQELLEALRDIVEGTRLDEFNRNDDGLMGHGRNFDNRIKVARAAIAKATGEQA